MNLKLSILLHAVLIFAALAPSPLAAAGSAEDFVRKSCAECHALSEEERGADFSARAERQGPPLDFAGDKFRRDWLVSWLQEPVSIRPAGVYPPRAVVSDESERDRIDESLLPEHPVLSAEQADSVADVLMSLRSRKSLVDGIEPKPTSLPQRMAELNFSKFKSCIACHLDQPDRGGVSGPELYSAWRRTTPEYLHSYIKDPAAWDRHTLMPSPHLNETEVGKLLGYLRLISEENE